MERVIVVFDVFNPEVNTSSRMVKLWNEDEPAAEYIKNYIDMRSDLTWGYNESENLKVLSPGAVFEYYGFSDKERTNCQDMITIYHTEAEDPDADPMKRILRGFIEDCEKVQPEECSDEYPYLMYSKDMLVDLLAKIDEHEKENQQKLTKTETKAKEEQK